MSETGFDSNYYDEISLGARGGIVVTAGSGVVTGNWGRIEFVGNSKLHGISAGILVNASELANPTSGSAPQLSDGVRLLNTVTAIHLHSGIAICYNQ